MRWLAAENNTELVSQMERTQRQRAMFKQLVRDTRARLVSIYASRMPAAQKRKQKAEAFAEMKVAYDEAKVEGSGPRRLRALVRAGAEQREPVGDRAVHRSRAGVPRGAARAGRRPRPVLCARAADRRAAEGRARPAARRLRTRRARAAAVGTRRACSAPGRGRPEPPWRREGRTRDAWRIALR